MVGSIRNCGQACNKMPPILRLLYPTPMPSPKPLSGAPLLGASHSVPFFFG